MDHQRVMKGTLTCFQLDRQGVELSSLRFRQGIRARGKSLPARHLVDNSPSRQASETGCSQGRDGEIGRRSSAKDYMIRPDPCSLADAFYALRT